MWRDVLGMYLTYMHGTGQPLGRTVAAVCTAWAMFWEERDDAGSQ